MDKRFRRIAALSITGVVIAGGAGTAYAAASSPATGYRLATATSADVTAALHVVGTLTPVRQADVAFSVDGSVAAVAVTPGQHVTAGQTLGSLDTASLKADLTAAQSALADANLQVDNDTASQNAAAASPATAPAAQPTSAASQPSSLRPLQQGVLAAQRKVDRALARAKTSLSQARKACAPAPSPSPSPSSPSPSSPSPSSPSPRSPSPSPSSPGPTITSAATSAATAAPAATGTSPPSPAPDPTRPAATCADATQRVLDAETAVLNAQRALSRQLSALSTALSRALAAAAKSSGGGGGSSSSSSSSSHTGGSGSASPAGPVSAVQLAADQASADAAAAQVTVAKQNLAAATVVSPISGTVVTVDVTPGSSTSAGSTAFVVAGLDSYQVVTEVPVTDMPELKAGQRASVQPDGMSTPLTGSVVSIGLVPDSSGPPVTYPVTIGLTGHPSGLHAGGFANVTITTARGSGVSVPTSAVHSSGHSASVTVYAGGKTHLTRVTLGTKGPVMTQITAGLTTGQQVVLANLSKPLPTNNLTNQFPGPGGGSVFGEGSGISVRVG